MPMTDELHPLALVFCRGPRATATAAATAGPIAAATAGPTAAATAGPNQAGAPSMDPSIKSSSNGPDGLLSLDLFSSVPVRRLNHHYRPRPLTGSCSHLNQVLGVNGNLPSLGFSDAMACEGIGCCSISGAIHEQYQT